MIGFVVGRPTRRRSRYAFAVVTAATGALLGASIGERPLVVAVLVPGVASVLIVLAATQSLTVAWETSARRWVTGWTLGAFALHLVAGLVVLSSSRLTGYFGGDAVTYYEGALALFRHWTQGAPPPAGLPAGKTGFYYLLAALFVAFGAHAQAGVVVNAAMAALVIPLLCDATRRHFGPAAVRAVPALTTLLPGFLIWGSQLLREAGVYFLIAVALNCAVRLLGATTLRPLVVMVVAIALLVTFRADVGLIAGAALAVALIVGPRRHGASPAGGIGAIVLVLALVLGGGLGYGGYRLVTHANLAQVDNIRSDSSQSAATGFLPHASIDSPVHAAGYVPLGASYFLLGPAPWQVHGGRELLSVPDVIVWWALLPSLWRGLREARRRQGREITVYVLPAFALTVVLALLIANFGTAVRERMQIVIILVPLIGLGWTEGHPKLRSDDRPSQSADR